MNRVDRLSAILIQLQSKKIVRAKEIAERFNISLRTVYRDIKALEAGGIPIGAEAGLGYYLVEGYSLPPVQFSLSEASALIMSKKLTDQFVDQAVREQLDSAHYKIKAVLPEDEKWHVQELEEQIVVEKGVIWQQEGPKNDHTFRIHEGLSKSKYLKLNYERGSDLTFSEREVLPVGLLFYNGLWHLIAFCLLRKDYRDFRLDRIKNIIILEKKFFRSDLLSLNEYLAQLQSKTMLKSVVVQFDKNMIQYIGNSKYYFGFVEEKYEGDKVQMEFMITSLESFARWLLSYGNAVQVLHSEGLVDKLKVLTKELSDWYLANGD